MRKKKQGRKFSRASDQRQALLASLVRELFLRGKMRTTHAKAKEVSRIADRMITKAKSGTLVSRRELLFLNSAELKTFQERNLPAFQNRHGGYTRVIKLGPRQAEGAPMAIVELVS